MDIIQNPQAVSRVDLSLVSAAQKGDGKAVVKLLLYVTPMVRARAHFYAPADEAEDYFQEGMLALFGALGGYDKNLSGFETFARLCVDRCFISLLRKRSLKKNIPVDKRVPLEDIILSYGTVSAEENFISREDYVNLMQKIRSLLSLFENKVLDAYLGCGSVEETVKLLGSNTKSVNNALCRIRAKLKKYKMPK